MRHAVTRMFCLLAVLCLVPSAHAADVKVRLGYTANPDFASIFVAKEQGFFTKHGIDAELTQVALNSILPAALVSGSLDLGGATPPVFLQAVAGGLDLVVVSGVSSITHDLRDAALVRPQIGYRQARDLEGKKVGVPGIGATLHVLFVRWLKSQGVDPKRVTFIETPFPSQLDLLKAGTVDVVVTAQPNVDRIVAAGTGTVIANVTAGLEGLAESFWVSTTEWARANPDAAKQFKSALADAGVFVAANPAATRADIAKYIKLPPKIIESLLLPKVMVDVKPEIIEWWINVLLDQKLIAERPKVDELVLK